jgi:hypothetical protein
MPSWRRSLSVKREGEEEEFTFENEQYISRVERPGSSTSQEPNRLHDYSMPISNAKLENDELHPAKKHSQGNRSSEPSRAHTDQMIETRHRRPKQKMHPPVVDASPAYASSKLTGYAACGERLGQMYIATCELQEQTLLLRVSSDGSWQ